MRYDFFQAAEESQRSEEPPHKVRIDGGKDEFDRRWGYLTLESIKENVIQHSSNPLCEHHEISQNDCTTI